MKRFTALVLVLLMVLSILPAFAADSSERVDVEDTVATAEYEFDMESVTADDRGLVTINGETFNTYKDYIVYPNRGWSLWVVLGSGNYPFTVYVENSAGTTVKTVQVGGKQSVRQKVVNSCNGGYYIIRLFAADTNHPNFTVSGGILQTQVA